MKAIKGGLVLILITSFVLNIFPQESNSGSIIEDKNEVIFIENEEPEINSEIDSSKSVDEDIVATEKGLSQEEKAQINKLSNEEANERTLSYAWSTASYLVTVLSAISGIYFAVQTKNPGWCLYPYASIPLLYGGVILWSHFQPVKSEKAYFGKTEEYRKQYDKDLQKNISNQRIKGLLQGSFAGCITDILIDGVVMVLAIIFGYALVLLSIFFADLSSP